MKKLFLISLFVLFLGLSMTYAAFVDDAVSWAYTNNLTIHKTSKDFKVDQNIRRDEAAKFFVNFAKLVGKNVYVKTDSECTFSDINQAWSDLKNIVVESCKLGIFNGTNGRFNPQGSLTNAQAVAVLIRIVDGYQIEPSNDRSSRYYNRAKSLGILSNIAMGDKNNMASRGNVVGLLYNAKNMKGLNYIHSENSLLVSDSVPSGAQTCLGSLPTNQTMKSKQNEIKNKIGNGEIKVINKLDNRGDSELWVLDMKKKIDESKITNLEKEAIQFESLVNTNAKNNIINLKSLSGYDMTIVPRTNFYNRVYEESLLRNSYILDNSCHEITSNPFPIYSFDKFQNRNIGSFEVDGYPCGGGMSIESVKSLFDTNTTALQNRIRYKNGIIGFYPMQYKELISPLMSCATDAVPSLSRGLYYETYDKNNYYMIALSTGLDYLMDFQLISEVPHLMSDVDDYYKGRMIGVQKKTDGMYPRLKQTTIKYNGEDDYMSQYFFDVGEEMEKYIGNLFSGKEKSKYFDETLERYKKKIDALYQ